MATIGVMSIMPMRGMTLRKGARMGSVISWRKITRGLVGSTGNQDNMARKKMAAVSTQSRIWMNRKIVSIPLAS